MKIQKLTDKMLSNELAKIHIASFEGFFLTFLGERFLNVLYKGFITHKKSKVLGAFSEDNKLVGFLAYSENISEFYKYLIKKYLIPFAWYSFIAAVKKPKIVLRLLRAFSYSEKSKRDEKYIELSSIGVLPEYAGIGIGSALIKQLESDIDFSVYQYVKLETDAENNEKANAFYIKNRFVVANTYLTAEGRKMNEYRLYKN